MALSLTAEQKSIFDIFSGKEQYIIPPYQRPYAWGNKHCRVLFDDLTNAYFDNKDEGYFLGNIVISQNRQDRNSLEVIDGQQRLTTLLLLIKALLQFDEDNIDLKNAIDIPSSRRGEETKPRLKTTVFMEKDSDYFNQALSLDLANDGCVAKKQDSHFKKNTCYFYESIKEFSKRNNIQNFIDFIMFDVYLLPIVTEGDNPDKARKKALKIFETINDRGLNLSTSDILKAKLYSLALNELKHHDFIEKWKEIEENCSGLNYSINQLFEIYVLIIKSRKEPQRTSFLRSFFIYSSISPFNIKKYDEVVKDLIDISHSIKIVSNISKEPEKYKEITTLFHVLSFINNDLIPLFIIYIYIYKIKNKSNAVRFLSQVVKFNLQYENVFNQDRIGIHEYDLYLYSYDHEKEKETTYNKIISLILNCKEITVEKIMGERYLSREYIFSHEIIYEDRHKKCFILLYHYLTRDKEIYPHYLFRIGNENKKNTGLLFYGIGGYVINDFLPKTNEDLKRSSVLDTKILADKISGKSDEEIKNIVSERKKSIEKTINKFMNE